MFVQKRYGESKIEGCPFCGKQSITTNSQDIPVCIQHKESLMNEMKCICGEYLETLRGKWGLYFRCQRCGNVNKKKVFEINVVKDVSGTDFDNPSAQSTSKSSTNRAEEPHQKPKEITITSRDTDWCD
jgi:uncharacterized C2H2 Zn-finger protein